MSSIPSIPSLPPTLSPALTGREAITDTLYRCVLGLDTNDATLFDSAFIPSATFAINDKVSTGLPAIHTDTFDVITKLDTTHFLTNIRINIAEDGLTASATASALSQHYGGGKGVEPAQPSLMAGSLYFVELVKEEGSGLWKIEAFKMRVSWAEGDWAVMSGN
ncbi:hypothetical protein BDW59DRAFT_143835 [Aspergillus cavernicola]|uniref:SnoaL-like domain-containing protein n=1 Tax=Aspergillus cavernicola TaxID=176166 RepID=A0ABR4IJ49_9EURO